MKLLFLLFALLFALKASGEVLRSAEDAAKEAHLTNINALLIFTSQEGLNTGLFHFTKVDVDMQIYNFPFIYHFDSQSDLNLFILGNAGYSRVYTSNEFAYLPGVVLTRDSHLQTYTGGLGLGARYKLYDDVSVMGGSELIYSRSGVSFKNKDESITDPLEDFFGSRFNDNLSYKLFFEANYTPQLNYLKPYVKLGYNFFDTKSDMGLKNLTTFSTQSSLLSLLVGVTSDPFAKREYGHLVFEPYINRSYLHGDVVKSIKFHTYTKVGTTLYLYHQDSPAWIERYFLEVSTLNADGIEGYNIGLGFSIDY